MKVPVLTDLKKIEFIKKQEPELQSGEDLVKVKYCGICGSDIHGYINGKRIPIGAVMGHEFSGVVSSITEDVKNVKPGDRVEEKGFKRLMDTNDMVKILVSP